MANVIFDRSSNATSEPIEDGKITFSTSGDGKMYLDNGTKRLEMGGAKTVDSSPSTTSTNPIQNKAVTNNFPRNTDVINTLSSVMSVNEPSIPCGTLAVKELSNKLKDVLLLSGNFSIYGTDGRWYDVPNWDKYKKLRFVMEDRHKSAGTQIFSIEVYVDQIKRLNDINDEITISIFCGGVRTNPFNIKYQRKNQLYFYSYVLDTFDWTRYVTQIYGINY